MPYAIRAVESRRDFREFLELPHRIYADDPRWVAPFRTDVRRTLDDRANPYFRGASLKLFTCLKEGITIARASVVLHPSYRKANGEWPALFGFFECENDPVAARELFGSIAQWCRVRGATHLCGPFNPHHYSELGLQIDGFDTPTTFFQTHNAPYYRSLLEGCGFSVERILETWRNSDIRSFLNSHPPVGCDAHGLRVRSVNMNRLDEEFDRIREVYNDAFAENCYFLPVSHDEYVFSAKFLRLVTRPELNVLVEHQQEPVGVLQCVLDVNPLLSTMRSGYPTPWGLARFISGRRKIRRLIVYAVGIKRRWQRSRVHVLLFNELHRMASGFDELETTWMSPDNALAIHAAGRFGMTPDKHFAMFRLDFGSTMNDPLLTTP